MPPAGTSAHTAGKRPSLRCALTVFAGAALHFSAALAADPQPYRVDMAPTGNATLDATLKATSQLQALRTSAW